MAEDTLDSASRNAILAKVAGLKPGKKLEAATGIKESKTPGLTAKPTVDLTAASLPEAAVEFVKETKSDKVICVNCDHKIWNDGTDWHHSGKAHNENCECREATPKDGTPAQRESISETKVEKPKVKTGKKVFTAETPFDELLEACTESHLAVKAEDEEVAAVNDEVRQQVIEKINTTSELKILKNWRF